MLDKSSYSSGVNRDLESSGSDTRPTAATPSESEEESSSHRILELERLVTEAKEARDRAGAAFESVEADLKVAETKLSQAREAFEVANEELETRNKDLRAAQANQEDAYLEGVRNFES